MDMKTKYDVSFDKEVLKATSLRLTNQLWKLIPMKEKEEDWQKQLNTVLIEVVGLGQIFQTDPQLLCLAAKLEGLLELEDIPFSLYRKTVFECISLIQGLKAHE